MRMIVRRELRKYGYDDVVEADNGSTALQAIDQGGIDLVVSDWNMPDMNGIELLSALRARGDKVAFGFVTSESAADIRSRAFDVGAQFVVTKPFTSDDLGRQVDLALSSGDGLAAGGGSSSDHTVDGVLSGLFERSVTVKDCEPPRREMTRVLAAYEVPGGSAAVYGVVEMSLAAGLACALARIPSAEAQEWTKAHAFNDTMESNFFEVANVLGQVASQGAQRCVLKDVTMLGEGERPAMLQEPGEWHTTLDVAIEGYPSGRLGFYRR
jgi:two-component system chemotaxis response regulator CheY